MFPLVLLVICLIAVALSFQRDPERTKEALRSSFRSLMATVPVLVSAIGLIGLALALTPPETLAKLFQHNGPAGFALVVALGSIADIPSPVAFPLAGSMLELGASPAILAIFITTLTMVGIVSIPMEIEFLGRRFTLLRQGLSFLFAIAIGGLMGVILP